MGSASASHSLGNLERLPLEVRDSIYEHFMHWNLGSENPRYRLRGSRSEAASACNSLALLRTSCAIHAEATRLMYRDWDLTFVCSHDFAIHNSHAPRGYHPDIQVQASHPHHGRVNLPPLIGPAGTTRCGQAYRRIPHHRWKSVAIKLHPPNGSEPGTFMMSWRGAKLLADVLASRPPARVNIQAMGEWHKDGEWITLPSKWMKLHAGILQLLLTPFGRLKQASPSTTITLQASSTTISALSVMREHQSSIAFISETILLMDLAPDETTDQSSHWPSLLGTLGQQQYYDLCIDRLHDHVPGRIAAHIRDQRFIQWKHSYECVLVSAASSLSESTRSDFLAKLVERWAVWRAMDPNKLKKDVRQ